MDFDDHLRREGVHHRNANSMQSAGDLVSGSAELAARVEKRHHDLERVHGFALRILLRRVRADGDPAAVVGDGDVVRLVDPEIDAVARSVHRLVDRVVEYFADEVVQPAQIGRPDVHAGPTTNCLEAFEDLNVASAVGRQRGRTALAPVATRYVFPYGHLQTFPARTRIS